MFLDEAYLQQLVDEAAQPFGNLGKGASATIELKISEVPPEVASRKKTSFALKLANGVVKAAAVGAAEEPALTLEVAYGLAEELFTGRADPAEQYMAGMLKPSGDMSLWLKLLPAWQAAG